jgi:hypothetical protein
MKTNMKKMMGLGSLLLTLSLGAFAGDKGGNGGFVYKCGDAFELVDLKEVNEIPFLKGRIRIKKEKITYVEQKNKRLAILKSISNDLHALIAKEVKKIEEKMEYRRDIDHGYPNDIGHVPSVEGCEITNVIQYKERILTENSYYQKLSDFDKAALVFHEAFYAIAKRQYHAGFHHKSYISDIQTSVPVRRIVAMLFAENSAELDKELKAFIMHYLILFGKEEPAKSVVNFCLDKKYINDAQGTIALNNDYFKKMKLELTQFSLASIDPVVSGWMNSANNPKDYWYRPISTVKREIITGTQFSQRNQRCDGSPGVSFVATSKDFEHRYLNILKVRYTTKSNMFTEEKELDASLVISIANETSGIKEDFFISKLVGQGNDEALNIRAETYFPEMPLKTNTKEIPENIKEYLTAQ